MKYVINPIQVALDYVIFSMGLTPGLCHVLGTSMDLKGAGILSLDFLQLCGGRADYCVRLLFSDSNPVTSVFGLAVGSRLKIGIWQHFN